MLHNKMNSGYDDFIAYCESQNWWPWSCMHHSPLRSALGTFVVVYRAFTQRAFASSWCGDNTAIVLGAIAYVVSMLCKWGTVALALYFGVLAIVNFIRRTVKIIVGLYHNGTHSVYRLLKMFIVFIYLCQGYEVADNETLTNLFHPESKIPDSTFFPSNAVLRYQVEIWVPTYLTSRRNGYGIRINDYLVVPLHVVRGHSILILNNTLMVRNDIQLSRAFAHLGYIKLSPDRIRQFGVTGAKCSPYVSNSTRITFDSKTATGNLAKAERFTYTHTVPTEPGSSGAALTNLAMTEVYAIHVWSVRSGVANLAYPAHLVAYELKHLAKDCEVDIPSSMPVTPVVTEMESATGKSSNERGRDSNEVSEEEEGVDEEDVVTPSYVERKVADVVAPRLKRRVTFTAPASEASSTAPSLDTREEIIREMNTLKLRLRQLRGITLSECGSCGVKVRSMKRHAKRCKPCPVHPEAGIHTDDEARVRLG